MECLTEVSLFRQGGAISIQLVQSKFSRGTLVLNHIRSNDNFLWHHTHPAWLQIVAEPLGPTTPFLIWLVYLSRHGESLFAGHALFSELKGPIGFGLMRDLECVKFDRLDAIFINGIEAVELLVAHANNGNAYTISRSINKVNCPASSTSLPIPKTRGQYSI
jgi:hypothetical protein